MERTNDETWDKFWDEVYRKVWGSKVEKPSRPSEVVKKIMRKYTIQEIIQTNNLPDEQFEEQLIKSLKGNMVLLADKRGICDTPAFEMLRRINSAIPIVLVSRVEEFQFNPELLKLGKYILVCYTEYVWDWDRSDTHIWGFNTYKFTDRLTKGEWNLFDDFVRNNPPALTFKRELLQKDRSEKLQPIEYPCIVNIPEPASAQEYNSRPFNVFNYWGRSHEARVKLHGNIWLNASENGAAVCDNIYYLQNFLDKEESKNKWVTLDIPWFSRVDIKEIMNINGLSKISISLAGSGLKCFRHSESPSSSLMAVEKNDYAWTFPWDETNSLPIEIGKECEMINRYLKEDLYDRYVKGIENCRNYEINTYVKYLEDRINAAL